jgi:hypothetical protein
MVFLVMFEIFVCCKIRIYDFFDFDNMRVKSEVRIFRNENRTTAWGQYIDLETNKILR